LYPHPKPQNSSPKARKSIFRRHKDTSKLRGGYSPPFQPVSGDTYSMSYYCDILRFLFGNVSLFWWFFDKFEWLGNMLQQGFLSVYEMQITPIFAAVSFRKNEVVEVVRVVIYVWAIIPFLYNTEVIAYVSIHYSYLVQL
jgi:hypothetical protein